MIMQEQILRNVDILFGILCVGVFGHCYV